MEVAQKIWPENLKVWGQLKLLTFAGMMLLKWILT
jgi:hypothetical protein